MSILTAQLLSQLRIPRDLFGSNRTVRGLLFDGRLPASVAWDREDTGPPSTLAGDKVSSAGLPLDGSARRKLVYVIHLSTRLDRTLPLVFDRKGGQVFECLEHAFRATLLPDKNLCQKHKRPSDWNDWQIYVPP
ncbi:hypothetical protein PM082_009420 [Marasmius tenuissimus]|nr:hypothetical protein PM082_009420 [Marasmius tenuissimus]